MTLCLAWKTSGNIHFASDSRITIKKPNVNKHIDVGIKLFSVPVKIKSPINDDTGKQTLDYDHSIGICFAGYTTNAYILKETVYEVLQRLQTTTHNELSMEDIAKVIVKFYEHISRKLGEELYEDSLTEFFLTGFCPKNKVLKTYKFEIEEAVHPLRAIYNEILVNKEIEFLGSGRVAAEKLIHENPNRDPLKLLRTVCQDENIPSVGGNIQYGDFNRNNDFRILGVDDYEIIDGNLLKRKLLLRGTQLYEGDLAFNFNDLHISYTFIQPFEQEINDFYFKKNEEV